LDNPEQRQAPFAPPKGKAILIVWPKAGDFTIGREKNRNKVKYSKKNRRGTFAAPLLGGAGV
jgi:hypothetical protein